MAVYQLDADTAESVAGVVRLLRRAAVLAWEQVDAHGPGSPRQVFALGIDLAADEARNLLDHHVSVDGPVPVGQPASSHEAARPNHGPKVGVNKSRVQAPAGGDWPRLTMVGLDLPREPKRVSSAYRKAVVLLRSQPDGYPQSAGSRLGRDGTTGRQTVFRYCEQAARVAQKRQIAGVPAKAGDARLTR